MKIDTHISELLYDHDCVIVPSFGGFLASYQPSQVQSIQHTFYPPSKKIAFNVFLKNNDGLLANYVAHKEKLTYTEALKVIENFRINTVNLLGSGSRITIEDVGTLFYDRQKNLQFEPDKRINYLEEAFGLTAVQSPPVKREEQRKKIERQIREAVSIRSSVKPEKVATLSRTTSAKRILNTVILSGALLWFSFNIWLITPNKEHITSLNPLSYIPSTTKVEVPEAGAKTENVTGRSTPEQIQHAADSIDRMLPDKQQAAPLPLAMVSPPAHRKATNEIETMRQSQKNFFIIAGVFHEAGNAEKLVASLKAEGFAQAEIVNPESAVKKVCYSSFADRKDAADALQQLHTSKKDGWIFQR